MKNYYLKLIGTLALFIALQSVANDQVPTITSFTPTSGPIGTEVTITGTNFDTTLANNIVFFGATQATVSAATSTSLTVTVPTGASYMPITVLTNGLIAYASSQFIVTFGGAGIDTNSFADAIDLTTGSGPYSVAIGDLDGDGKSDLAVANISSNTVSVFRNTSTGTGTVSYDAKMDFATDTSPISVAIGDLDGDGKLDLAVANSGSTTLSIFRNTSTGAGTVSYDAKVDYATGSSPYSVVIGDLDGDGKSDLAVANRGSSTLSTFRNTSTGAGTISFAAKLDYATGSTPSSIAMGDFDSDGKPDLVVANRNDNTVSVLRNTSAGAGNVSFDTKVDFTTGVTPNAIAVGDLDGDGKIDLAVGNNGNDARSVSVLRNTSTGSGNISYDSKIDFTTGVNLRSVAIGDLDGDNMLDIVATGTGSNQLSILRNTSVGDGNIAYAPQFQLGVTPVPTSTAIGDLDGDGRADLIAAMSTSTTQKLSVFRNTIASAATDFTAFSLAEQVGEAVINATDHTVAVKVTAGTNLIALVPTFTLSDGASAAVGINAHVSGTTSFNFTNAVTYTITAENSTTTQDWVVTVEEELPPTIASFSPTSGTIGTTVTITGTNFDLTPANNIVFFGATQATVSAATATQLTVTVPSGASYQPITVLVDGLMAYSASPFVVTFPGGGTVNATSFDAKQDYTTGSNPYSVAIGDLDGDGKADLAIANGSSNTVSVFRNISTAVGSISYAAKQDYTTGSNPYSVAIGDLDGDGKLDLAVANRNGSTISVFRNTSTGSGTISYASKVDYSTGSGPRSVAIGDLDGDGKADLAVVNWDISTVSIFRNTSTGAGTIDYATKVDYTTGSQPHSVAIGDLDGDGKTDLAVANRSSGSVSILRNTSTGTGTINFATKVDYSSGTQPHSVAIGDLNGDGKADLAVVNVQSNTVSLFQNTSTGSGNISYAAKVDYTSGTNTWSVAIGDLNGDGKPDLVLGYIGSNTAVSILQNTSTGSGSISYATKVDQTTGTGPYSTAIGDLDGDGKLDVVVGNVSDNTVSVLRNAIESTTSTETDLTAFSLSEQTGAATIDATNHTIAIEVANGTDVTALVPTFELSTGASAAVGGTAQVSGTTANDFTSAVTYTVTAEDGTTTQDWVVTVTEESSTGSVPTISTFSPTSGPIGTEVTITGTNFSTTAANNIVFFGATQATVSAATSTSLTVTVPTGASYQPITVLVDGLMAYAASPFVVTFDGGGTIDSSSFDAKQDYTTGTQPRTVAIGDLDGDGKVDLAVANYTSNTVSVFRNTSTAVGTISYAAKQDYTTGTGPWSVAIGDLDGDGKADLAVANYISNTVSVYRNTSTGVGTIGYAAKQDYTTGSNPRSVAIGDLDGDGKADLAVANYISNTVSVLRNTSTAVGTISYAAKQDYTTGTGAYSVAIGDLDGDGKADLAVVNVSSTTVSVFRNTSTGVGTISYATKQDYTTGTQPYLVAIGDLDGDGKADLAVANYVSNTVSVFRNTSTDVGTMNYAAKQDYTTGNAPNSVVICDLDGDGKVDLAIVNQTSRTVSVFRNTSTAVGTISYAAKQDYTTGSNPYSVAIGDLDGDGKADLAVVNGNANTVSVFRNAIVTPAAIPTLTSFTPTSGPIGTEVTITGTNFSTTAANNIVFFGATQATVSAATATQLTVKVPSGASYQPITVLVDGLMAYSASPFVVTFTGGGTIDASSFAAKQDYTTGSAPYSVAIGDLDGDGKADLAVANRSSNTVSVFRNTSTAAGTISYATKQDYTTGTGPYSVVIGDLDGDGKADLAVANINSNTVSVLRNTSTAVGTISYAAKQDYTTGTGPISVTLGDLNGNGKADLAVANNSSNTVSVFRNTSTAIGTMSYAAKQDYTTGTNPASVAIGDLDGDGKADLAVANYNSATVSVFRNTSTGVGTISYAAKQDYITGTAPNSVAIGDLDGDGKADLAVANNVSTSVSVFRNTSTAVGSISYAAKQDYTTGSFPNSVAIGDLDGDGKADLAVANRTSATVSLFRNTSTAEGKISYDSKQDFITETGPWSVALGDLDGDGKADLAVANGSSASFSVFRNAIESTVSTETDITAFSLSEQTGAATIDGTNHTIAIEVASGTDATALVPTFALSTGASATVGATAQVSGTTANDFTSAVTYTVTAADGTTTQDWVVTVQINSSGITGAPVPPARAAGDVISIFSDAYTNITNTNFNPNWNQSTVVTIEDIEGNSTLKYANFNYQGMDLGSAQDVSGMEYLHVDFWTSDATILQVTPVEPSGSPSELLVSLTPIVADSWNSFDIPLTDFTGSGMILSDVPQLKFEGDGSNPSTIYIDNIYFYKTVSGGDVTAPTVTTFSPADNATSISANSNLVMTFSENIQKGSGNILIKEGGVTSQTIAVTNSNVSISGNVVTINPADFTSGSTVNIEMAAGVFEDLANNNYAGITNTTTWNFTVAAAADVTAPTVTTFSPADNATNISANSNLVMTFSEDIQKGSGNILIKEGGATSQTIAVTNSNVSISGNVVTINPADFTAGAAVNIEMAAGVFEDLANNNYAGITNTTTWNFTVAAAADVTAPTVTTFSPADNATNVTANSNLVMTFSEDIQKGSGNILIKEGGVTRQTIAVTNSSVSISGNVVTINPADFTSGSTVNVEMAAGVFQDLANNNYAGITNTTTWNFTVAAAATNTPPTISNQTFDIDENSAANAVVGTVVASDDDQDALTYSIVSGNTSQAFAIGTSTGELTVNSSNALDYETNPSFSLSVRVSDGNASSSATITINLNDIDESLIGTLENQIVQPSGGSGTSQRNYSIISFPFRNPSVSTLLGELGPYDNSQWRLFRYNGSNQEYSVNFTDINSGQGYWFIQRESNNIQMGGTSVDITEGSYKMNLVNGFNLIGNPFAGTLNWREVIDYNVDKGTISLTDFESENQTSIYTWRTSWRLSSNLEKFEGGFIKTTRAISNFEIPLSAVNNAGGRIAQELPQKTEIYIDDEHWKLNFHLHSPSYDYYLGGIGLSPLASDQKDILDGSTLPRFIEYLEVDFGDGITRSMKHLDENKSWSFKLPNNLKESSIHLTWDRPISSVNTIILIDSKSQQIVDLSSSSGINVSNDPTIEYYVYFGKKESILDQLNLPFDVIHEIYPNPTENKLNIRLYASDHKVGTLKLISMDGKEILNYSINLEKGMNNHEIRLEELQVPEGIYYLNINNRISTKLIKK